MNNIIGDILQQAIGVAISPLPIAAVILLLFSKHARSNGLAFLTGWIISLAVAGSLMLVAADAGNASAGGTPSTISYVIKLLLGLLLIYLAINGWRKRPQENETPKTPGWMAAIDSFSAVKSFGLAVLTGGLNIKNLAFTGAAAMAIAEGNYSGTQTWIALAIFVAVASISIAIPVIYYLVAGSAAEKTLNGWKGWLIMNSNTVMIVLFLIIGVKLVGIGLDGLLG